MFGEKPIEMPHFTLQLV